MSQAPARHEVPEGQRQARVARNGLVRRVREHGPQRVDMRLDASTGLRLEFAFGRHFFRLEAGLYECAQVETRVGAPSLVLLGDLLGILQRARVDETLAVLERALHLNPLEKAGIQIRRRRRRSGAGCAHRAGDQPEQQPRGSTHQAPRRPDQNS